MSTTKRDKALLPLPKPQETPFRYHDILWRAEEDFKTRLAEDPKLGAELLAAMRDPDLARRTASMRYNGSLRSRLYEELKDGWLLRQFVNDAADWLVVSGVADTYLSRWEGGGPVPPLKIKLSLEIDGSA